MALLVVTLDARVARWARRAIVVGPGATLTPSVLLLGPDVMPVVTSWRQAARQPELALLSVMAHGKGDPEQAIRIAHAAFAGARQAANARRLDEEAAVVYSTAICEALGPAARKAFEMYPDIERFFDSATRKKIHKARAEGKAEGKAEGRADAVRAKRDAVLAVLHARGLTLTDRQRARIAACMDDAKLDTWLRRAVTAPSTTAVFARRPAKNTPRASSASSSPPRRSRSRASAARSSASRASPR